MMLGYKQVRDSLDEDSMVLKEFGGEIQKLLSIDQKSSYEDTDPKLEAFYNQTLEDVPDKIQKALAPEEVSISSEYVVEIIDYIYERNSSRMDYRSALDNIASEAYYRMGKQKSGHKISQSSP